MSWFGQLRQRAKESCGLTPAATTATDAYFATEAEAEASLEAQGYRYWNGFWHSPDDRLLAMARYDGDSYWIEQQLA